MIEHVKKYNGLKICNVLHDTETDTKISLF